MAKKVLLVMMLIVLIINIAACEVDTDNNDALQNGNNDNIVGEKDDGKNKDKNNTKAEYELTGEGIIKPEFAKKIIEGISNELIDAISTKDFETVSKFIHPIKGVRFTPYTYISSDQDVVFDQEGIKGFFNNQNVYIWGVYDGVGDDISLTPAQYYEKFIYTEDFKNAEEIGYNKVLSMGNMIENQFEVYDNPIVVEYYFSGFNPDYAGLDWRSLRLVFEQYENDWKLVGIIHNQWTT